MPAPKPPTRNDPAAYAAMMADPGHRARVEAVMATMIEDYEWYMAYGNAAQRFQLIKTALPDMLRARRAEEENARDEQMREAFMRLREAVRDRVKDNVPDVMKKQVA